MKGDGHIYIVYDANGKSLPRPYRMRGLAKQKALEIGGTIEVVPQGVRKGEAKKATKGKEAQEGEESAANES